MVVFLDLDDETHDETHFHPAWHRLSEALPRSNDELSRDNLVDKLNDTERPNPNLNGFSAALSCYPIVASLASHLDLNTLHDLSRTCRQFRANLLQYRKQLIAQSLKCFNDAKERSTSSGARFRESHAVWNGRAYGDSGRFTSGKVGQCARDKVGECQKCGLAVCRNCIAKPPPLPALKDRHRRLCGTCIRAPLLLLEAPYPPDDASYDQRSPSSSPSNSPARLHRFPTPTASERATPTISEPLAFTAPAFLHAPCNCPNEVWLCQSCRHALRVEDTQYRGKWTWRVAYSTYLGGLGTGIGEGNEGVACGRGSSCLAFKVIEQERDCDADELQAMEEAAEKIALDGTGRSWQGGAFAVQEMEGVGGVVKKKTKELIRMGKQVAECEDERAGSRVYLDREAKGEIRSWCSWCERVVPSKKDLLVA